MLEFLRKKISTEQIEKIERKFAEKSKSGNEEAAWDCLQGLIRAQSHQEEAAISLIGIVKEGYLSIDNSVHLLTLVSESHLDNDKILSMVGDTLESARDIDQLNSAPPEDALFLTVIDKLGEYAENLKGSDQEEGVLDGLATAARLVGHQRGALAEKSYRRLLEIDPEYSAYHYNLGLFYKTRGRFSEGIVANQKAASLSDETQESYEWNLGICATGAGEGEIALKVWQKMEQKLELGRFGLPEGTYPQCKVRLAERPLAERTSENDDPGLEETIWIERLSPCHGIVRSVLFQELGVNYGDVVLIDGAPITYHTYGDTEVPVFPHLSTLYHQNYQVYDFAATQSEAGQVADASTDLIEDAIIYSHTENFQVLCATCWRDPDIDHEHHESEERNVVTGKISAPKSISPDQLLEMIDKSIASRKPCSIYIPDLCEASGHHDRALVESRRFDMLNNN